MPLHLTAWYLLGPRLRRIRAGFQHTGALSLLFITITAAPALHGNLCAQSVPSPAPLPSDNPQEKTLPDLSAVPRATPIPQKKTQPISWECDQETRHDDLYTLKGNVVVTYGDRTLYADTVTYDQSSTVMTLEGHVKLIGGINNEHVEASHGTYNVKDGTGRFYDVTGSIQVRSVAPGPRRRHHVPAQHLQRPPEVRLHHQ